MGYPGIYYMDINGKRKSKMKYGETIAKEIANNSFNDMVKIELELAYRRGELIGLTKAMMEIQIMAKKLENKIDQMENELKEGKTN